MANILLTQQCVRACPYCFAKKHMAESERDAMISWEDMIYIADLFEQGNEKHLSLLGGEPTLHPHFVDFMLYLLERKFRVAVFTSGIMAPKKLEEMAAALKPFDKESQFNFVCNLNHPGMSTPAETARIEAFLTEFGPKTNLSFNMFRTDFDMEYLFDYIRRFKLVDHIRLGLAAPIPGEDNLYIKPEEFKAVADRLLSFMPLFRKYNVSAGFDCAFPLCAFTDEQLGKLTRQEKGDKQMIRFVCNPALDIGPDMQVWSCFPLSRYHKRSLYEFNSVREIYDFYRKFHVDVRKDTGGAFPECLECVYRKNNKCAGGCLAHIINRTGLPATDNGGEA